MIQRHKQSTHSKIQVQTMDCISKIGITLVYQLSMIIKRVCVLPITVNQSHDMILLINYTVRILSYLFFPTTQSLSLDFSLRGSYSFLVLTGFLIFIRNDTT